jgi:class 3 adenylate cyclase
VAGAARAPRCGPLAAGAPEILQELDRIDEAQTEARAALTAFDRLGAAPDAKRTRRLLAALDDAKSAKAGAPARVTRTFMFTDIVGSTNLLGALGDEAWRNLVRWHDQLLRAQFQSHGGEEIDHAGDGFSWPSNRSMPRSTAPSPSSRS